MAQREALAHGVRAGAEHDSEIPEIDLLSPLELRSLHLRNRIAMSPMCQYSSHDGFANDVRTRVPPPSRHSPTTPGPTFRPTAGLQRKYGRFDPSRGLSVAVEVRATRGAGRALHWVALDELVEHRAALRAAHALGVLPGTSGVSPAPQGA